MTGKQFYNIATAELFDRVPLAAIESEEGQAILNFMAAAVPRAFNQLSPIAPAPADSPAAENQAQAVTHPHPHDTRPI